MFQNNRTRAAFLCGLLASITGIAFGNTTVLLDDFNDGDFAGWTVVKGAWTITNGKLVGHETWPNLDAYIYAGDTNWSDMVFEADVLF